MSSFAAAPEKALAAAIADLQDVDPASVAGLLDDRLDAAVSSRSSHQWDPDGVLPNGTSVATVDDVGGGGTDFSGLTEGLTTGYAGGANQDVLSISGSGLVLGISLTAGGQYNHEFEIETDGSTQVTALMENFGAWDTPSAKAVMIEGPIPFNASFRLRSGDAFTNSLSAGVTYALV